MGEKGEVIGAAGGRATRALSGSLTDYGINDDFVRKLDETIPVDSSALFVLVKSVTEELTDSTKKKHFCNPFSAKADSLTGALADKLLGFAFWTNVFFRF